MAAPLGRAATSACCRLIIVLRCAPPMPLPALAALLRRNNARPGYGVRLLPGLDPARVAKRLAEAGAEARPSKLLPSEFLRVEAGMQVRQGAPDDPGPMAWSRAAVLAVEAPARGRHVPAALAASTHQVPARVPAGRVWQACR